MVYERNLWFLNTNLRRPFAESCDDEIMAKDYNGRSRNVHTERLSDPNVPSVANDKAENMAKAQVKAPSESLAGEMIKKL